MTQTNTLFYGLTKNAKSILKGNAKYAALMRSSKFTHRDCLEKQKPSLHRWQGWHSENSVPGFPQEREMPVVTNLLIWDTGQLLLKWAFPSTNNETNVEATEVSRGLAPFVANSPESWHGWAKRVLPVTLCHGTPVCSHRHQGAPRRRPFLMVENRDSILTSHRATLSGHRMRQKEKPHPVFT